jgi:hypothetical protein
MDGPCHLYNSNLINHLVTVSPGEITNFFVINKAVIPNWTGHLILSLFNLLFPAWVAEKVLIIFYLLGISISFRLLLKQFNPDFVGFSVLIVPFAYSFLFHLGFYNYCLSFVFLFFTIYYWLKNSENNGFQKYIVLFVLSALTYLSAILTFFFLGFCLGIFTIVFSINDYCNGLQVSAIIKKRGRQVVFLLAAFLPGLFFSVLFFKSSAFLGTNEQYTVGELVKWLNDVRCIIVYDYTGEEKLTEQFLHIAIIIVAISLFMRFSNKSPVTATAIFRKSDVFLIPCLLALVFLFIIPNGSNAGMMSDRFCLLAYMFFIVWVAAQPIPKKISSVLIVLIIIFQVGLLFKRQNGTIRDLNKHAVAINDAAKYIAENSIVLPVNMSENWIEPHFSNYLGVDKPMVILENYEATVGWFPVQWNEKNFPRLKLGDYDSVNGLQWKSNIQSNQIKHIDYVFLYGNTQKVNDPVWSDLKNVLDKYYALTYVSEQKYAAVYKRK